MDFVGFGKFWSAPCLSFKKINVLYCSPQQVLWRWAWCSWCSIWKGLFEDDFQFGSLEARERHLSYLRVTRTKWPFLATATHWASQFEADTMVWVDSKTKTENAQDQTKYSLCCSAWFGFDINCFYATHKWALFKEVVCGCAEKYNCGTGNEFQGLIWMTWKVWLNSNKVVISESLGLASVF